MSFISSCISPKKTGEATRRLVFHQPAWSQTGFAYLWTLFMVAFLGVSLVIGVELYHTAVRRDQEKALLLAGNQFRRALQRYYEAQSEKREYPVALEDLLKDPRYPQVRRHLRQIYLDPVSGKAEWGVVRVAGRIVGVHSLSEKAPIKRGNFEPDDADFAEKEKYSEWVFTYPPHLLLKAGQESASAVASAPQWLPVKILDELPAEKR